MTAQGQLSPLAPEDVDVADWLYKLRPGGERSTTTPSSYAT